MAGTTSAGRVSVSLYAETAAYSQALKTAYSDTSRYTNKMQKKIDTFAKNTNKKFGGIAKGVAAGVGAMASLATATFSLANSFSDLRREQNLLAKQIGVTTDQYVAMDVAAKSVGLSGEQLADITKDITDKAREFERDGTGGFADFAAELGLSEDAAREMAGAMVDMTGPQAMQFMIEKMDEAGLSTKEMTQALESMGSDLSKAIPLYQKGGKNLDYYEDVMSRFAGTSADVNKEVDDMATGFDIASSAFIDSMQDIAERTGLLKALADQLARIAHFYGSLNENSKEFKLVKRGDLTDDLNDIEARIKKLKETGSSFNYFTLDALEKQAQELRDEIDAITKDINKDLAVKKLTPEEREAQRLKNERIAQEKHNAEMLKIHQAMIDDEVGLAQLKHEKQLQALDNRYSEEAMKTQAFKDLRAQLLQTQADEIVAIKKRETEALDALEQARVQKQYNYDMGLLDLKIQAADTELERLKLQHEKELAEFDAANKKKYENEEAYQKARQQMVDKYEKTRAEITKTAEEGSTDATEQNLDELYGLQTDEEGNLIAQSGAAATAQLGIDQAAGIGAAYAKGPVYGLAATAAMVATFTKLKGDIAASVNSFAVGSDSLSEDQFAFVHEGERIVPKKSNQDLGQAMSDIDNIHKMMEANRMPALEMPEVGESSSSIAISAPMTINGTVTDQKWFAEELVKHRQLITASVKKTEKERPNLRRS